MKFSYFLLLPAFIAFIHINARNTNAIPDLELLQSRRHLDSIEKGSLSTLSILIFDEDSFLIIKLTYILSYKIILHCMLFFIITQASSENNF